MSYCRWSSDNFNCDLYIYEDVSGGWTTHIAGRRRKANVELPTIPPEVYVNGQYRGGEDPVRDALWKKHWEDYDACFEDIPLKFAGETFNDATLDELLERVMNLRDIGYRFPDHVIDRIKEEMAADDHN